MNREQAWQKWNATSKYAARASFDVGYTAALELATELADALEKLLLEGEFQRASDALSAYRAAQEEEG